MPGRRIRSTQCGCQRRQVRGTPRLLCGRTSADDGVRHRREAALHLLQQVLHLQTVGAAASAHSSKSSLMMKRQA
eukprot:4561975-Prymnesium_polylepis.2